MDYCKKEDEETDTSDMAFSYMTQRNSSSQNYRQTPTPVEQLYKSYFTPESIGLSKDSINDKILWGTTKKMHPSYNM
jgi:hypothetical protein